ncbi:MAG: hypothetical protein CR981_02790, partial [Proteobacteria bacterium]
PSLNRNGTAVLAMLAALIFFGSFEWIREAARRPYAINEVVYSNMLMKDQVAEISENGFLKSARFVKTREVDAETMITAGEEIFIHQCYACHTLDGFNNEIVAKTEAMSFGALRAYIRKIHQVRYFMPPFAGTDAEADALAAYIAGGLHKKEIVLEKDTEGPDGAGAFDNHCSACHAAEDLAPSFEDWSREEISASLASLDEISDEMVPFDGSSEEKAALVTFLFTLNNDVASSQPLDGTILFEHNCAACHGSEDMAELLADYDRDGIREALDTLETLSDEMVPYDGSPEEKEALTDHLNRLKGE